jgi:hypothetical protein
MIGVTSPRRVAAISTAKRVAHEMNVEFGAEVSYQVCSRAGVRGAAAALSLWFSCGLAIY